MLRIGNRRGLRNHTFEGARKAGNRSPKWNFQPYTAILHPMSSVITDRPSLPEPNDSTPFEIVSDWRQQAISRRPSPNC